MVIGRRNVVPRWVLGAVVAIELAATAGIGVSGRPERVRLRRERDAASKVVRELRLSGLALGTETGFVRQPALAVPSDALSVHPAALDRFPAGSLIPPPAHVARLPAPVGGGAR